MAQACADSLHARGWEATTLDVTRLPGPAGGAAGVRVLRPLLGPSGWYDAFHFSALRPGARPAMLAEAAACRRLVPELRRRFDGRPADLVVSVFATAASAVNRLY